MSTPAAPTPAPTPVPTPGQTVGPFFHDALPFPRDRELVPPGSPGSVVLRGRVLDGAGEPVPDALVELWQTAPDGTVVQQPGSLRRDGVTFTGWGRCATDGEGRWSFVTLRPGTPYVALTLLARGLLDRLQTRAYLPDAPDDDLLAALGPRAATLRCTDDGDGLLIDLRLQGEHETVFLDHSARAAPGVGGTH